MVDVISSCSTVTCAQTMVWTQLLAESYRQLDAVLSGVLVMNNE